MEKVIIKKEILSKVIKKRDPQLNKTNFGRLLLICGSASFGGAAIMSTRAAVYSGAGLVTLASDKINRTSMLSVVPEAMFMDYKDTEKLKKMINHSDVILIGSGLEKSQESLSLINLLFTEITDDQILVIDGTALSLIGEKNIKLPDKGIKILTPHQGEWQRISKLNIENQKPDKNYSILKRINADYLVLKGPSTEIYSIDDSQKYYKLTIGGPFQAVGGMGDTLAGIIASFVGQFKTSTYNTIQAAVYLHSASARSLSQQYYTTQPSQVTARLAELMAQAAKNLPKDSSGLK